MSVYSNSVPSSSFQTSALFSIRSTTPVKSASWPIGIWIGSGLAPSRSRMVSTALKKSAPVRSILLT